MKIFISLLFLPYLVLSVLGAPPDSLRLVSVLYRHGDRNPEYVYPKDNNTLDDWKDGLGWLSNAGKKQQFELGLWIKQRYDGFINTTRYNHNEIQVQSSSIQRCLMSAYCNLAGLFAPKGDQVWNPDLLWQPVPVQTRPKYNDNKLAEQAPCPRYNKLFANLMKDKEIQEEEEKNKEFYKMVEENTGVSNENIFDIWRVIDTLVCEQAHNMTWNDWVKKPGVWEKLLQLRDYGFSLLTHTDEMARLKGGPLLKEMIGNMNNATVKTPVIKFYMYSAHDTTVSTVLRAMQMFNNPHQPIYRALLMVELHEIDNSHVIKVFYRNDTEHEPYELTPEGCDAPCTLENFIKATESTVPDDWNKECGVDYIAQKDTGISAATVIALSVALGVCFTVMVAGIVLILRLRRRGASYARLQ